MFCTPATAPASRLAPFMMVASISCLPSALKTEGKLVLKDGNDEVQIDYSKGDVYINGERLEEPYIKEKPIYTLSIKIPPDCYFLLGDNRNNSGRAYVHIHSNIIILCLNKRCHPSQYHYHC